MDSSFRRLVLDQVEAIVAKGDPTVDTLGDLLRIATPSLKQSDLSSSAQRSKLYKALLLRIHPDKHPNDERATKIFQSLECFYGKCISSYQRGSTISSCNSYNSSPCSPRKRARTAHFPEKSTDRYPSAFDAFQKWSHIGSRLPFKLKSNSPKDCISKCIGYQCISARGAIAHGKQIEVEMKQIGGRHSASSLFQHYGGFISLHSDIDIKHELVNNGPIVSDAFTPTESFMERVLDPRKFVTSTLNGKNGNLPVLIIGWNQTSVGEVWIVAPLQKTEINDPFSEETTIQVAFGQYGIEDECIAPKNRFDNMSWEEGPFFDLKALRDTPEWREWPDTILELSSEKFETLALALQENNEDFISAVKNKSRVVLRDATRKAHSRAFHIVKIVNQKRNRWEITIRFEHGS